MKYKFTFFKKDTGKYYTEELLLLDDNINYSVDIQRLLKNRKDLPLIFKDKDLIAVVEPDNDNSVPFLYDFQTIKETAQIKCKNCKHYATNTELLGNVCNRLFTVFPMKPNDFCSYAEQLESEVEK